MNRTRFRQCWFVAFFVLLVVSCDRRNEETSKKTVDKAVTGKGVLVSNQMSQDEKVIDFASQPLAVPTGTLAEIMRRDRILADILAEGGYSLRVHSFASGSEINAAVTNGEIELAVAGDMPAISIASSGKGTIVALAKENYSVIVAGQPMQLSDLKGRRIGFAPASSAHYVLLSALEFAGLKEEDVVPVPMEVSQMANALVHGEIDAFAAWEPTPAIALKEHENFMDIHRALSTSYFYVSTEFLQRFPDVVRVLVASAARALNWMALSQENLRLASEWSLAAAKDFTGKEQVLRVEEYARFIDEGMLKLASSLIIPQDLIREDGLLHREFLFMHRTKMVPVDSEWERTRKNFDREIMIEVFQNPDRYRTKMFDYQDLPIH